MEAEPPCFCLLIIYSIHTQGVSNISSWEDEAQSQAEHISWAVVTASEKSTRQGSLMIREHWGRRDSPSAGSMLPSLK